MKKWLLICLILCGASLSFGQSYYSYYSTVDPSNAGFMTQLQTRIRSPFTSISYDNFSNNIDDFASFPADGGKRKVQCVYMGDSYWYTYTPPFDYFSSMNREHTWCQSWFPMTGPQYSDQHHLFPTNPSANSSRGNNPLDKVVSVSRYWGDSKIGTDSRGRVVFEPRDSHKGDAARALLYMSVKHNGVYGDWTFSALSTLLGTSFQDVGILLQWHQQDPPDKWEVERNNYIQSVQKNRNPFVDHPEWVSKINFWNLSALSPVYSSEPQAQLSGLTTASVNGSYIDLTWTLATGTPAPTAYMVLAYDTNNYFIPMDGVSYTEDSNLSDGKALVYIPHSVSSTQYRFSGLNPNTSYYFKVYACASTTNPINYKLEDAPSMVVTTFPSVLDSEPANHVASVSATTTGIGQIKVTFPPATGSPLPTGYLLVGSQSGSFSTPLDGNVYADDAVLTDGNARVNLTYSTGTLEYTFSSLSANKTYYFRVYPYNGAASARNYKTDGTIPAANATTPQVAASPTVQTSNLDQVTPVSFRATGNIVDLGYPNPTQYGFTWNTADNPVIGTNSTSQNGPISTTGSFSNTLTGLLPQTQYFVRAYATNSVGTAYGNSIALFTLASEPTEYPTNFTASNVTANRMVLSWTPASGNDGYLLLMKAGTSITGRPVDGTVYVEGETVGDATVASLLLSSSLSSYTVSNLIPSTGYSFILMPFLWDEGNPETFNYLTTGTVPSVYSVTSADPYTGPAAFVNEFSQGASGAKEWVELVVTQASANLQNWKLTDGNGSLSITLSGTGFSNLPAGTLIVIYNGGDVDTGISLDTTLYPDQVLKISSLNSTGIYAVTRTTGWNSTTGAFGNSTNTDGPILYNASATAMFTFPSGAYPGSNQSAQYTGTGSQDPQNATNWTKVSATTAATPGLPNGGSNTTWIMGFGTVPVELSGFEQE